MPMFTSPRRPSGKVEHRPPEHETRKLIVRRNNGAILPTVGEVVVIREGNLNAKTCIAKKHPQLPVSRLPLSICIGLSRPLCVCVYVCVVLAASRDSKTKLCLPLRFKGELEQQLVIQTSIKVGPPAGTSRHDGVERWRFPHGVWKRLIYKVCLRIVRENRPYSSSATMRQISRINPIAVAWGLPLRCRRRVFYSGSERALVFYQTPRCGEQKQDSGYAARERNLNISQHINVAMVNGSLLSRDGARRTTFIASAASSSAALSAAIVRFWLFSYLLLTARHAIQLS